MSGLPQEYVRRVVETLANFEDDLIATQGFFAREEHLENCIEGVRTEFEADRRAVAVFAVPGAVSTLISTLCDAEKPPPKNAPAERRRFENAFAATVLLSSGIGVRALKRNPPLLKQLWELIEQPGHHPVLLHYWARCASALLLSPDRMAGLRPCIALLGLSRLLLPLVRLIHCEAVRSFQPRARPARPKARAAPGQLTHFLPLLHAARSARCSRPSSDWMRLGAERRSATRPRSRTWTCVLPSPEITPSCRACWTRCPRRQRPRGRQVCLAVLCDPASASSNPPTNPPLLPFCHPRSKLLVGHD